MAATTDREAVLAALKVVIDPDLRRDIVSLGFVKDVAIDQGRVSFTVELTTPACPVKDQMREQAAAAVRALPGVADVAVQMTASVRSVSAPETGRTPLPGVKNVVAVGAGKGGVGKTTVSVNLALELARCGSRVGILDGDIYGPNAPIMLGLQTQLTTDGKKIVPAERLRGPGRVDGLSDTGGRRGHLARPHAARCCPVVLSRGGLERSGLPDCRHASGDGRRRVKPQPDRAGCRCHPGHHAPAGIAC